MTAFRHAGPTRWIGLFLLITVLLIGTGVSIAGNTVSVAVRGQTPVINGTDYVETQASWYWWNGPPPLDPRLASGSVRIENNTIIAHSVIDMTTAYSPWGTLPYDQAIVDMFGQQSGVLLLNGGTTASVTATVRLTETTPGIITDARGGFFGNNYWSLYDGRGPVKTFTLDVSNGRLPYSQYLWACGAGGGSAPGTLSLDNTAASAVSFVADNPGVQVKPMSALTSRDVLQNGLKVTVSQNRKAISASFEPSWNLTLEETANLLHVDYLNWVNVVTHDDNPPTTNGAKPSVPYFDPPFGGWDYQRLPPPDGWGQEVDSKIGYWDETADPQFSDYSLAANTSTYALHFEDMPGGIGPGQRVEFHTFLVGFLEDGHGIAMDSFRWECRSSGVNVRSNLDESLIADGGITFMGCLPIEDVSDEELVYLDGLGIKPIPEPVTLSLLALGRLAILRRRSGQVLRRRK